MINHLFPLLNAIDAWLGEWIPGLVRMCLWGGVSGAAALLGYWLTSNQEEIARLKNETRQLRRRMLDLSIEQAELARLMKSNLLTSLKFLHRVGMPSMLASVPVLVVILWLSAYHAYAAPTRGESLDLAVVPVDAAFTVRPADTLLREPDGMRLLLADPAQAIEFGDCQGPLYTGRVGTARADRVYKEQWWNSLLANEAGYIRQDAQIEEIHFQLQRKRFAQRAPEWLVTWEFPYFLSMLLMALALKFALRIE